MGKWKGKWKWKKRETVAKMRTDPVAVPYSTKGKERRRKAWLAAAGWTWIALVDRTLLLVEYEYVRSTSMYRVRRTSIYEVRRTSMYEVRSEYSTKYEVCSERISTEVGGIAT